MGTVDPTVLEVAPIVKPGAMVAVDGDSAVAGDGGAGAIFLQPVREFEYFNGSSGFAAAILNSFALIFGPSPHAIIVELWPSWVDIEDTDDSSLELDA